jgi:hypothetical protein
MLRCMSPQDKNRRSRHGKFTPRHDGWRVRSGHAFASLRQANAGALLVSGDPFFSSRRQPPPARAPGGPFLIESAILSFPLHPLRPHDARTRARAEDGKIDIYGITLPPARSGRHHISLSRCPSSGELLGRATNQLRRNSPFSLPR